MRSLSGSWFVACLLAACETIASAPVQEPAPPPGPTRLLIPAPAPAPAPTTPPKSTARKVTTRDILDSWIPKLPRRALFVSWMGLGGSSYALLDVDTRKLTKHLDVIDMPKGDVVKTLPADQVAKLWTLAETAWRADSPKQQDVTDYRMVLVAVDGDDVFYLSAGGPIDAGEPAELLATALGTTSGLIR